MGFNLLHLRPTLRFPLAAYLVVALALASAACSDPTLTHTADGDNDGIGTDRVAYDPRRGSPDDPDAGGDGGGPDTEIPTDRCCVMVPAIGEPTVEVGFEGDVDLGVFLFDLRSGDPVPDEMISWAVEGDGAARLSAANAFTDLSGRAQIRFQAGASASTYRVTASHPGANSVSYEVRVRELPVGSVAVTVRHPAAALYNVSPINIRLFPRADLRCDMLSPGEYPADYFVQGEVTRAGETATFDNLLADSNFTVLATGLGGIGEIAAQGCVDDVFVREGETRSVEVILQLLPLNPQGEYDVQSYWDFTDALLETGSVGTIIVDILDLFENPGEQLLDYMLDAIGYFVGSWVSDVIDVFLSVTRLDRLIEDAVNDLINSSDTLRGFFSLGCDLRRIVTRLQVLSILSIGKLGSDFEVFGIDTWVGLGICDFTPDPDFVVGVCDDAPDCERVSISIEDGSLGLLRGDWTGRVLSYNQLTIDRHPVDFNYGRLILFVLETFIFPALTGDPAPVTLEDVFSDIINCEGFGDFITGSDGEICVIGCITDDDIEGFCDGAVSLVFGTLFEGFVGSLSFDSVMEMRGSAVLVNTDTDTDVERLEDGEYTGTIYVDSSGSPFNADFEGDRR